MIIKITVTLAICLCSETLSVFFQSAHLKKRENGVEWPDMYRVVCHYASSMHSWKKPISDTQWADLLEIYQNWYSALNPRGEASSLPIHHPWCIADKLRGNNKLLLRGWPQWWKWKLPHGHHSIHSPLFFNRTVKACLSVQGNSYKLHCFLWEVCVRVCREQAQFVSRHGMESPPLSDISPGR